MANNIVVIFMSTVPESVRANTGFYSAVFSNDGTKRQLDGYVVDDNENTIEPKRLCHPIETLLYWCRNEPNPQECIDYIMSNSYELKVSDYRDMKLDPDSEWHVSHEVYS